MSIVLKQIIVEKDRTIGVKEKKMKEVEIK